MKKTALTGLLSASLIFATIPMACATASCPDSSVASVQHDQMIEEQKEQHWTVEIIRSPPAARDLSAVFFLDENIGWIGGRSAAFKTSDAGRSWKTVNVPMVGDETIESIRFIDDKTGWLVLSNRKPHHANSSKSYFKFLSTSSGGATWKEEHSENGVVFTSWDVDDAGRIWIGGMKYREVGYVCFEPFLSMYQPGSLGWRSDLFSKPFEDPTRPVDEGPCPNEAIMGIVISRGHPMAITSNQEIFEFSPSVSEWKKYSRAEDNIEPQGVSAFGLTGDNRLWFVNGVGGEEGEASILSIESDKGVFKFNRKSGFVFRDACSYAEGKFLVVGSKVDDVRKTAGSSEYEKVRKGIVSHTVDSGNSFEQVFEGPPGSEVIGLSKSKNNPKFAWALTNTDKILRLKRN